MLPACTDSKDPKPGEADVLAAARGRLAVLAQATADGAYDATYRFVQKPSNATGSIRIRQNPPQYRIDVTSKTTASFMVIAQGVVSCTIKVPKGTTCFLVAKPGEEVPALFDPGVQRLFRDAVIELAEHPTDYVVVESAHPDEPGPSVSSAQPDGLTPTPMPSGSPLPLGQCFSVERVKTASPSTIRGGFEDGTYCFAEQGYATRIEVASGVLELVSLGGAPHENWFKPPATVQKLPDLPASATPTPSKT